MNKIIVVFCEGQHDIAFLSRILFVDGFTPYNKKINKFIKPLNEQYIKNLENNNIADRKLGFQSEHMIPSVALHKNENILVLFHNLSGEERSGERKSILDMYKGMQSEDDGFSNFNLNFRFLYFFDADDKGITTKISNINEELELSDDIEYNELVTIDSYEWACYIFHKSDEEKGDLEDVLLELMKPNNKEIFDNSEVFLKSNELDEDRQKEFVCNSSEEKYKTRNKYKEKKSIISIAGQLQFSGMANATIIANSDYIKKSDIENNKHCKHIVELFQ